MCAGPEFQLFRQSRLLNTLPTPSHGSDVEFTCFPCHREIDYVSSYKTPSFQDRIASAGVAKKKALEQLRSRPPVDEKVAAERQAKRLKRQTIDSEKAAAKKAELRAAKESKAAEAAAKAVAAAPPSEAERKAARDARYAARKARK